MALVSTIQILKGNGEVAFFDQDKLVASFSKSGGSDSCVQKIMTKIENLLYDGISSKKLYKLEKHELLNKNIVLCKNPTVLFKIGIEQNRIKK